MDGPLVVIDKPRGRLGMNLVRGSAIFGGSLGSRFGYIAKVTIKGEEVKFPKKWPRGLWMTQLYVGRNCKVLYYLVNFPRFLKPILFRVLGHQYTWGFFISI